MQCNFRIGSTNFIAKFFAKNSVFSLISSTSVVSIADVWHWYCRLVECSFKFTPNEENEEIKKKSLLPLFYFIVFISIHSLRSFRNCSFNTLNWPYLLTVSFSAMCSKHVFFSLRWNVRIEREREKRDSVRSKMMEPAGECIHSQLYCILNNFQSNAKWMRFSPQNE